MHPKPTRFSGLVVHDEKAAFLEGIRNANSSKHDVYVIECVDGKEIPIYRIYHHFIDDFGYYNPTEVMDLRTMESYYVSHNVEYCANIKGYYWGKVDGYTVNLLN